MKLITRFSSLITKHQVDSITFLKLNNAKKRNSLSKQLLQELHHHISNISNPTKVLVLGAEGHVFSSGHDLKELLADNEQTNKATFQLLADICLKLQQLDQPTIGVVDGLAAAGGCQLILSNDIVIASDISQFSTPGIKVGLFCSTPSVPLSRNAQDKKSLELLFTGDNLNANDALQQGIVNHVVKSDQIKDFTLKLAQKIAKHSLASLSLGKKLFYEQRNKPAKEAYQLAIDAMILNLQKSGARKGIEGFIAKKHVEFDD